MTTWWQAWRLTNDLLVEPGGRPWIAEMYGFSFGAASVGVSFHWNRTAMIYPRDYPEGACWLPAELGFCRCAPGQDHCT